MTILDVIRKRWPWVKHLFADAGYDRLKLMDKASYLDFVVEIVRRSDQRQGFEVLPRRWVVERSFGWMTRWRRLVREYEARIDVCQAMILVAISSILHSGILPLRTAVVRLGPQKEIPRPSIPLGDVSPRIVMSIPASAVNTPSC